VTLARLEAVPTSATSPSGTSPIHATYDQYATLLPHARPVDDEEDIINTILATAITNDTELVRNVLRRSKSNDFAIWDDLLVATGAAVYPGGALLNHSCTPNCTMQYIGASHVQVRCQTQA
jgi:SET and MYND domain-containing protein